MDNQLPDVLESTQPTTSSPQYQPPKKSKRPLVLAGLGLLVVVMAVGGYFLAQYMNISPRGGTTKVTPEQSSDRWHQLTSTKKGVALPRVMTSDGPGVLRYYSFDKAQTVTKDLLKLGYGFAGGGSANGLGDSGPVASPNLLYTAYIGQDNNLWLFSHETERVKNLTKSGFVSYITSWSPDSKSLVFFHNRETLEGSNQVIDGPAPETVTFKPQVEQGFYHINIETGKTTPLAALDFVEGFIDNDNLLVRSNDQSSKLVSFNIPNLKADQTRVKLDAGFGVGQIKFSSDGKQWTYTDPINRADPTKGEMRIVFGAFPDTATTVVDSGPWAAVQWPMFSPDGKKIAYVKSAGLSNGMPQNKVWVYDIATKTKGEVGEGEPIRWMDNATVLSQKRKLTTDVQTSYVLLNIETKKVTPIDQ